MTRRFDTKWPEWHQSDLGMNRRETSHVYSSHAPYERHGRPTTADLNGWDPSIWILVAENPEEMEWLHESAMIVEQTTKLKVITKWCPSTSASPCLVMSSRICKILAWYGAWVVIAFYLTSFHTALSSMSFEALDRGLPCDWSASGGLHATIVHDTSLAIINDDGLEFFPLNEVAFSLYWAHRISHYLAYNSVR